MSPRDRSLSAAEWWNITFVRYDRAVKRALLVYGLGVATITSLAAQSHVPRTAWPSSKVQAVLERTARTRLAPDLSYLTAGERTAVARLLQVGGIFQDIYEQQRHRNALTARAALEKATDARSRDLLRLYSLNQGPIATTLENAREPFLAVDPAPPGKNVYPWDLTEKEFRAYLAANPTERPTLTHLRHVVRRADAGSLSRDLAVLGRHAVLDALHPGLKAKLTRLAQTPNRATLYGLPYSVAYADESIRAHRLMHEAADAVERDDEEFARFLRNRARDLLTDDYEAGDASWLKGRFKNLNAQIGAYETYDDELMGTRAFYGLSLLSLRGDESVALRKALQGVQSLEDSLPIDRHKRVLEDIPVGVYDVIADFGQARGGNTATNLPNEAYLVDRYGSIILLRANIMRDPNIFEGTSKTLAAAIGEQQAKDLTPDGNFYRTLWHEVGHYLGVDRTKDGRELDEALQDNANALEEMKADLVSLFVADALHKQGYYTDAQLRSVYAGGILRVLQNNRPRRDQPYNTMQLMQWNFYLENGLLSFEPATKTLRVHYDKYHDVVGKMLEQTLAVQYEGDKAASDKFIDQYTRWDENLHGVIAANIRAQQRYRFRLFKYAALGE
jgi:hypothetical protein